MRVYLPKSLRKIESDNLYFIATDIKGKHYGRAKEKKSSR